MWPTDASSAEAFAESTRTLRHALVAMVDSYPRDLPNPSENSLAMLDLAVETRIAGSHPGWGEPSANLRWTGAIQVLAAAEACAAMATLIGDVRAYLIHPYMSTRLAAESAGRAKWLFDPAVGTVDRFIRVQNLKIEDLTHRQRIVDGKDKSDAAKRCAEMRDAAQAYGLGLTKRDRGTRYIAPGLESNTWFAKQGFAAGYGSALNAIASSAVHGSTTAMLTHVLDIEDDPLRLLRAKIGVKSDLVNVLMLAAGASFRDAANAQLQYHGIDDNAWTEHSTAYMATGWTFIQSRIERA